MRKYLVLGITLVISLVIKPLSAQEIAFPSFTGTFQNTPLDQAIKSINDQTHVSFYYHDDWLNGIEVTEQFSETPLDVVIDKLIASSDLSWMAFDETNIVILNESKPIFLLNLIKNEKENPGSGIKIIGATPAIGKPATITGNVKDEANGDALIGATFYIDELKDGVVTDLNGDFSITIPTGRYNIRVESIGFDQEYLVVEVISSGTINFSLMEAATQLNEILITESRIDENVQQVSVGIERLDVKVLRTMPQFMGEVDIIKGLITLPGVSTVGEGASGFNVRGGTVGQNLILQDEALIFNSSHLFGFFSAFNPDVVRDITLYKGNPPATHGGRLSSILDIRLKNGSSDKVHLSGGIGTVSSKLVIDGPLIKGKGDFVLGGRVSYVNWFLGIANNPTIQQSTAHFYDLNARFNYNISDKDRITLSGYKSFDDFKLISDTLFTWETQNVSAIWRHSFNANMLSDLSIAYGQFNTKTEDIEGNNSFIMDSHVHHLKAKLVLSYITGDHKIDFGGEIIDYNLNPATFKPGEYSVNIRAVNVEEENGLETALFVSDEFKINEKLSVTAGLRYSNYIVKGPKTVYLYEEGFPKSDETIVDLTMYANNETITSYGGIEPRLSLRYLVSPTSSLKFGYARNRQYIHLISNTTAVSPQDFWQSSNFYIPPEIGDQVSLGYFQNFFNNKYEFSVEGFYKYLYQTIDYKEGAKVLLNEKLEQEIIVGIGKSYGVEVMVKKSTGRLTGWMSYTYSRSLRKFESAVKDANISLGEYFPSNYDKPHDLTVLMNYQLSRGVKFSANFTYSTGRPVTAPVSKYSIQHILSVQNYSQRNQFRIPDYHRLDISFTFGVGRRKDRKVNDEVIFSVYNIYGRKNAYSVYFNQSGFAYKLSVLGTAFPSISYNFKI